MIHYQQIGSGRIASQLGQKTGRIGRTIAAQAEVVLAADALPEGRSTGEPVQLSPVAVPGFFYPGAEFPDFRNCCEKTLFLRSHHLVPAVEVEIILPALCDNNRAVFFFT